MIILAGIPDILKRFDRRLAIIKGNQLGKRYLREWRTAFRIDKKRVRNANIHLFTSMALKIIFSVINT